MTKIYVKSDYIPEDKNHLTSGKIYEGLLIGQGTGFTFTDDNLRSDRYGSVKRCAHLGGNDWTIVSEEEYLKQECKPWYKVGDKVRVVKCVHDHQHEIGEVIEVERVYDDGSFYSGEWWLEPEEVEPYIEEESVSFVINTSGTDKLIEDSGRVFMSTTEESLDDRFYDPLDRVFMKTNEEPKLTLRDQFAMSASEVDIIKFMGEKVNKTVAVNNGISGLNTTVSAHDYEYTAEQARYRFADAMLKAREETL